MRGISYEKRQKYAEESYESAMIHYRHKEYRRPIFNRHNLFAQNSRWKATEFGFARAVEMNMLIKTGGV
jgi:hypothetical protein